MSDEGSNHRKASRDFSSSWNKVRSYSKGDSQDKIKALDILLGELNLPSEKWLELVVKLAEVNQPLQIRRRIALRVEKQDLYRQRILRPFEGSCKRFRSGNIRHSKTRTGVL
jgi:hypothetical protein